MRELNYFFKNVFIGLVPSAYVIISIFLATITGVHVFYTITLLKVMTFLISLKIITIEFALASFIYKDRRERIEAFVVNTMLLVLGLTIFSIV